jgi:hypothetical protein
MDERDEAQFSAAVLKAIPGPMRERRKLMILRDIPRISSRWFHNA